MLSNEDIKTKKPLNRAVLITHDYIRLVIIEVTSITNRMLGRKADLDWLAKNPGQVVSYKDVDKDAWWYGDIMEASNGHDYDKVGKAKVWTRLNHKSFA